MGKRRGLFRSRGFRKIRGFKRRRTSFVRRVNGVINKRLATHNFAAVSCTTLQCDQKEQRATFLSPSGQNLTNTSSNYASTIMHDPVVIVDLAVAANGQNFFSTAGSQNSHIAVKSWENEIIYKNSTNIAVHFWEYRMVARRDIPRRTQSTANVPGNLDLNEELTLGLNQYLSFNTQASGAWDIAPSAPTADMPGWTPYMNTKLCTMFKIKKVRRVLIPPGATWTRKYKYKKDKQFKIADFFMSRSDSPATVNVNEKYLMMKGTSTSFVVFHGEQVGEADTSVCTLGECQIQVLSKLRVHYCTLEKSQPHSNVINTLNTIAAPLTIPVNNPVAPVEVKME